ncbi:MAG: type IX secretion system sortase PorU, partial [Candidatus Zixiibacteriota bacterium]
RVHEERDKELDQGVQNYRDWYWLKADSVRMKLSLPGAVPNDTNFVKVKAKRIGEVDIWVNQEQAEIIDSLSSLDTLRVASTSAFRGGMVDTLDFSFSAPVFLDYYEVEYWRRFECHDRQLFFESPETQGVVQYEISNLFSSRIYVFDVTDKFEVKMLDGVEIDGEYAKFQDSVEVDFKTRYYLVDESRLKKPVKLFSDEGSNLRDVANQADFLIITHSDFYDQAQSLKSWRSSFNQMKVKTIKVQDIYDEFSGGLVDPVAIRDFLRYAYQEWQPPAPGWVLLVGDGTYDHKDNLSTGAQNFIPPFTLDLSMSDDMFVRFGDTLGLVISRLPVRSESEAEGVVNKIIGYEREPEFGVWRNLITLVADDEWKGVGKIDHGLWQRHTPDTEELAKSHVPLSFNISKVYLMEYPFDYKGEKPQAGEAIVNSFNSGSLIINYIGHANPDVWTHERVFKTAQDIPKLENKRKLPLVYMATCRGGFFFSPFTQGMAEELLRAEEKGAVATISAVLSVYAEANAALNYEVYDLLLRDSLSLGEALFTAKLRRGLIGNDKSYVLFGDPIMRLGMPSLKVELTQVTPDTLSALSLVSIEGEVWGGGDHLDADFNGEAYIFGFDSQRENVHEVKISETRSDYVSYDLPGLVIFRGGARVKGGRFSASFVVPKDISYGGNTARVSVYVFNEDQDGAGAVDSLVVLGSDTTVVDTTGPEIAISFEENPDFMEGDIIPPSATLQLSIFDEHGINITGELGHGITLVIDEDYQHQLDLTKNFQYDLGSFQKGSLSYRLPGLSQGAHLLSLKAWDNANNSSLVSVRVEVRSQTELELTEVMNYPNPFSNETKFYYCLSSPADMVRIEIFTLAGRLIRTISGAPGKMGINFSTTWDAKDQDGDEVANGVYIYKVVAEKNINGEARKDEVFGKAVVLR